MNEDIYLGIKGRVIRVNRENGSIIWETHLKSGHLTTLAIQGGLIVAYTKGELFGIDKQNGKILWRNGLSGFGYGHGIIAAGDTTTPVVTAAIQEAQQAGAAAG